MIQQLTICRLQNFVAHVPATLTFPRHTLLLRWEPRTLSELLCQEYRWLANRACALQIYQRIYWSSWRVCKIWMPIEHSVLVWLALWTSLAEMVFRPWRWPSYALKKRVLRSFVWMVQIGGVKAPSPVGDLGNVEMTQAMELSETKWECIGRDMLLTGKQSLLLFPVCLSKNLKRTKHIAIPFLFSEHNWLMLII